MDIKVHYFLELDYNIDRPLTIWGAGAKGKQVAKLLITAHIPFYWLCDNQKKIGKHIYDQQLYSFNLLKDLKQPQTIVAVANKESQQEIKRYFETNNMKSMTDFFFFC